MAVYCRKRYRTFFLCMMLVGMRINQAEASSVRQSISTPLTVTGNIVKSISCNVNNNTSLFFDLKGIPESEIDGQKHSQTQHIWIFCEGGSGVSNAYIAVISEKEKNGDLPTSSQNLNIRFLNEGSRIILNQLYDFKYSQSGWSFWSLTATPVRTGSVQEGVFDASATLLMAYF